MSDEQDKLRVSLEAPKLFGRKKKPSADESPAAEDAAVEETVPEPEPMPVVPEPDPIPEPEPQPDPIPDPDPIPEPDPESTPAPAPVVAAAPVTAEPVPQASMAGPIEDAPAPAKTPAQAPAKPAATTLPKKASAKEPTPGSRALGAVGKVAAVLKKPVEQADADAVPLLTPYRAAAVTGLVVGGAMVLLTWLALRGCEAVRGTSSCGGGPGFVLLLVTFVLCVYLGSALLRAFVIPDPGSSSFLAVGLVAVVALLFLINMIDNWSMIIVIPLLTVAAYLASVWVTETFVESSD